MLCFQFFVLFTIVLFTIYYIDKANVSQLHVSTIGKKYSTFIYFSNLLILTIEKIYHRTSKDLGYIPTL